MATLVLRRHCLADGPEILESFDFGLSPSFAILGDLMARRGWCMCPSSQIAATPHKHTPRRAVRSEFARLEDSPNQGGNRFFPKLVSAWRACGHCYKVCFHFLFLRLIHSRIVN